MARARTLAQLSDAELERRFIEAERNALEWSAQAIGRHAEDQATKWMRLVGECRAEIERRAAGGEIERSPIEALVEQLRRIKGVDVRAPAKRGVIDKLGERYILPSDYIELLQVADGATNCFGDHGELRSATSILGDRRHPVDGYRFVKIARAGRAHEASFDTADLDGGREPTIIETGNGTTRHRGCVEFLTALVARLAR